MKQIELDAKLREQHGKGANHKLRSAGQVPGVLYARGQDNVHFAVEAKALQLAISAGNAIIHLKIANGSSAQDHLAMIGEVQRDVFQKRLYHVDFRKVSLTEKMHMTVPISFQGHARGEKDGGIVEHLRREVEVEALPGDVPHELVADVSDLGLGDSLHVRDLTIPASVTLLTDPDEIVAVIHASRAASAAEETATAEGAAAAPAAS